MEGRIFSLIYFFNFFLIKKKRKEKIDGLGGVLNFPYALLSLCKKLSTKCHLPKAEEKGGKASFLG